MALARKLGRLRGALAALLLCLVAACAGPNPWRPLASGMGADEVHQRWGAPSAIYPATASQAERWQYSLQPSGQQVHNVDFGPDQRVQRVEQVLSEALFAQRIRPDVWQRAEVLHEYGSPAEITQVHNFKGDIWVWRYLDGPVWRLLYIDIDPAGVVRGWSLGDENLPDPPEPR